MDQQEIQASGFVIQPRLSFEHCRDQMIFQLLMAEANYMDYGQLRAGQLTIVLSSLEKETGWTRRMITTSLERLQNGRLIDYETLPQKRGVLVTIRQYSDFQKLTYYTKNKAENVQEDIQPNVQENTQADVQGKELLKPCSSKAEGAIENENIQENVHAGVQRDVQENVQLNNITAFINSISNNKLNSNKTLKDFISDANVKSMNLTSSEDIQTFVDFALQINAFPEGTSEKILKNYFDCIRLTRATCSISAKLLTNLIEKMSRYSRDQLHYAMWKHVADHDAKPEKYTLGILRNVPEHEARRGLIKLKNMKGASIDDAIAKEYAVAAGAEPSSTRAEAERLQELARSKGLGGSLRDPEFDF